MLKNYNYMLTILFYPFILILSYLSLNNMLKGEIYQYLISIMIIIFIPSFIMSLYMASEEILSSNKKWRMILLIFLSIFYLPIYYTKYVSREEKYLGYILLILTIPLTIITSCACEKKLLEYFNDVYKYYVIEKENYVYYAPNNLFSIAVDPSFRCNKENIGEYTISCDRLEDDSFIGIYSYNISSDNEEDIYEKLEFHIDQTIGYIKEKKYNYEINDDDKIIRIDYDKNTILITQENYEFNDIKYSLVIMKEMPKELINYSEFQKMIDSIVFLNYN